MQDTIPRQEDNLGPNQVQIRIAAAGVNRPDILQRKGLYPPPLGASPILGLEVSGTITAVGPGASRYQIGDPVCALVNGGGYAESCTVPEGQCLPIPAGFSLIEAAALPESFFTVWTNVFDRGHLRPGERILIHGGSSGIGTTAIQLAKAFGAHVTVTAGTRAKCDACLALGADEALNYHEQDFTRITPVNLILDMVGGSYFERNLQCLAPEGRLLQIAHLQGRQVQLDLAKLMQRRLTLTGSTLRPRSPEEKAAIARALETHVWPLLSAGKIRPVIYRTFPLADYLAAHDLMESNQHIGKIVLIVDSTLHPQP